MQDTVAYTVDRALSFFSVFDVSFLVSGTAMLGAEVVALRLAGFWPELDPGFGILLLIAALVLAYVNGLLVFTLGRSRRGGGVSDRHWRAKRLGELARAEGLQDLEPFASALAEDSEDENARLGRAYVRLWNEVRVHEDTRPTFHLARQYWVRSAIFDGLSIALLAWAVLSLVSLFWVFDGSGIVEPALRLVLGLGGGWGAWRLSETCEVEARAAERYQVDELVQAMAWRTRRPGQKV